MQIAPEHAETECERSGPRVKEGFLFHRIALGTGYVSERDTQDPASIESDLADTKRAVRDRTAMPAGQTAYPIVVKLLVELSGHGISFKYFRQSSHGSTTNVNASSPAIKGRFRLDHYPKLNLNPEIAHFFPENDDKSR